MYNRKEYTLKKHVARLKRAYNMGLLENGEFCPAARNLDWNNSFDTMWDNNPCRICQSFVCALTCPCLYLGDEVAKNRTIEILASLGVIKCNQP